MSAVAAPPSPYKGLAPFEDSALDALLFFGREREIEVIVANLMAARLTVLFGPSGVGKTSLLRAGVAHRLRSAHGALVAVVSAWAGDPLAEIFDAIEAAAGEVGSPPRRRGTLADTLAAWTRTLDVDLYLILDQFEEYFLYHEGEGGAGTLAEELPEAVKRAGLRANFLIGIREDSLAALDALKPRIPNLFGNSLRLDRLDRPAARAAVVGPLERYNELVAEEETVSADPELVGSLLDQVAVGRVDIGGAGRGGVEEAAADRIEAPYLQLVLERVWEVERASGSRQLRLSTLAALGGAAHIVEDHLERAMAKLSPHERDAAAAIYNHLVTPSGTKIAHRAGDLAGYAAVDEAEAQRVLHRLVKERIVRAGEDGAGGPRYEIFHDVLAEAVLVWRTRHEAERRLAEERDAAARRHRRLLAAVIGAGVVIAALTAIAVFAFVQRRDARHEARHAQAQELVVRSDSELADDPERSVALALRAARLERSSGVEDALRRGLSALRIESVLPARGSVAKVAFDRSGRFALVAGAGGARLFDSRTGDFVRVVDAASTQAAAFSPDGRVLVTGGDGGALHVWRTRPLRVARTLSVGSAVTSVMFAPTGRLVVATTSGGDVRLWRLPSWHQVSRVGEPGPVSSVSFSGDGRFLVTSAGERVAHVFDGTTGRLVRSLRQPSAVTVARFAPTGTLLATAAPDRVVRVWDASTGRLRRAFHGHTGPILDVAFSPDGGQLVSASADESARIWDVRTGGLIVPLLGHENFVTRALFSPDGEYVATASVDGSARLFESKSGALRARYAGHRDKLTDLAFSSDGTELITGSKDGTARIWDARPRRESSPLGPPLRVGIPSLAFAAGDRSVVGTTRTALAFRRAIERPAGASFALGRGTRVTSSAIAPGGDRAATGDTAGRVRIWSFDPRADPARLVAKSRLVFSAGGRVASVSFSPSGRELLTADGQRTARVWSAGDGTLMHTLRLADGTIVGGALSRDGRRAVTRGGNVARIWDLSNDEQTHVLVGHTDDVTSASFSPDGRLVVTTSKDHDARIWAADSGRFRFLLRGLADYAEIDDAAFSSDGRWVVTAGPGYAGLWSARTGRLLFFVRAHEPILQSAAFSHRGWRIATGGAVDGRVETFDCLLCGPLDDLIRIAQVRLAAARG